MVFIVLFAPFASGCYGCKTDDEQTIKPQRYNKKTNSANLAAFSMIFGQSFATAREFCIAAYFAQIDLDL